MHVMYGYVLVIYTLNFLVPTQSSTSGDTLLENNQLQEGESRRRAVDQYIADNVSASNTVIINKKRYTFINVVSYGAFDEPAHLLLKARRSWAVSYIFGGRTLSARLFATSNTNGKALALYEANILKNMDKKSHDVFPKFVDTESVEGFEIIVTKDLGMDFNHLRDKDTFSPVTAYSVHHRLIRQMLETLRKLKAMKLKHNNISPKTVGWRRKRHVKNPFKLFGFKQDHEENRLFSPWGKCVVPGNTDEWYGGLTLLTVALKNSEISVCSAAETTPFNTCDAKGKFFEVVKVALKSKFNREDETTTYLQSYGETEKENNDQYVELYTDLVKEIMCGSLESETTEQLTRGMKYLLIQYNIDFHFPL